MRGSPGSQASTHSAGVELRPFIMRANRIAIMTRDKLKRLPLAPLDLSAATPYILAELIKTLTSSMKWIRWIHVNVKFT